jgi:hypothetical protein
MSTPNGPMKKACRRRTWILLCLVALLPAALLAAIMLHNRAPAPVAVNGPAPIIVDSGFVFIGGRYVETPYRIQVKGNSVYLNEFEVQHIEPPGPPPDLSKDPGAPPGLTPDSTIDELFAKIGKSNFEYVGLKWGYIVKTMPEDKQNETFIAYLKGLPPVADAKVADMEEMMGTLAFDITLKDGTKTGMIVGSAFKSKEPPPPRDIPRELASHAEFLKNMLNMGGCLLREAKGGSMRGCGKDDVADSLLPTIEILESTRSASEKLALLRQTGILAYRDAHRTDAYWADEYWATDLIANFKHSDQLSARLKPRPPN